MFGATWRDSMYDVGRGERDLIGVMTGRSPSSIGSLEVSGARESLLREVADLFFRRECGECCWYASSIVAVRLRLCESNGEVCDGAVDNFQ